MYRFQLKLPTSLRDVLEFKTSNITAKDLNIGDYNILKDKIKFQKLSSDQLHLEIVLERRWDETLIIFRILIKRYKFYTTIFQIWGLLLFSFRAFDVLNCCGNDHTLLEHWPLWDKHTSIYLKRYFRIVSIHSKSYIHCL